MKHCISCVILRDGIFPIDYPKLGAVFKGMLPKAQQVEDATQCLQGKKKVVTDKGMNRYI